MAHMAILGLEIEPGVREVDQVVKVADHRLLDGEGAESEEVGVAFLRRMASFAAAPGIVQASYNANGDPDKRYNFPGGGCGWTHHENLGPRGAFVPPSPYASWVLDEGTCIWVAPVPLPDPEHPEFFDWDEPTLSWADRRMILTRVEFALKFTLQERIDIRTLAGTDPIANDAYELLFLAERVRLDHPSVIQATNYFESAGAIGEGRAEQVLAVGG